MKSIFILLAALCVTAAGCNRVAKVDNPVAPEPPPRISLDNESPLTRNVAETSPEDAGQTTVVGEGEALAQIPDIPTYDEFVSQQQDNGFRQTAAIENSQRPKEDLGTATGTVVLVNGEPIFAEDVLQEFAVNLAKAEKGLPPEKYREVRATILRRRLPVHIESKLLSAAMLKTLKKEQREGLDTGLEEEFQRMMEEKKQKLGISSQGELDVELAKQGLTLHRIRKAFNERQLAQLYVVQNAGTPPKFGRQELLDHYYDRREDFAVIGKVKWRHIQVSFEKHKGEIPAAREIELVRNKLIDGADFAELAQEHSDGPTALEGGLWDWMERGSLADEELEAILYEIPRGTVSDIFKNKHGFHIVQVVDRVDPGYAPFPDVYDQIATSLREERYQGEASKLINKLKQTAVIESNYDLGFETSGHEPAPYELDSHVEIP